MSQTIFFCVNLERWIKSIHNGAFSNYRTQDGLSSDIIWSLFEDREESLWPVDADFESEEFGAPTDFSLKRNSVGVRYPF